MLDPFPNLLRWMFVYSSFMCAAGKLSLIVMAPSSYTCNNYLPWLPLYLSTSFLASSARRQTSGRLSVAANP